MRGMKAVLAVLVTAVASGCGAATQATPTTQETPATQTTPTPSTPSTTAPTAATASPPPQDPEASLPREAAIYSTVLDRFLGTELSVGGPSDVDTVYILDRAGLDQGSGGHHPSEVSSRVQQAVEAALADDYRVRWIDDLGSVKITGRVDCVPADKSNVVIALGTIPGSGQQIQVSLDGHADCGLAGGWVYRLAQEGGSWKVVKYRASWQT